MPRFDKHLIRPTHLELVQALEEAARQANALCTVVEYERDGWEALVRELRHEPEGFRHWLRQWGKKSPGGVLTLAWWTDFMGRRHFRVSAGSSADEGFWDMAKTRDAPPFWYIAPRRIFARERAGERVWFALCPCGRAGTLESLGWMGTCCGFCHDRRRDTPAVPESEPAPIFTNCTETIHDLFFAPDGGQLVARTSAGLHLWRIPGATHRFLPFSVPDERCAVAVSHDGTLIVVAGADRLVRFIDAATLQQIDSIPQPFPVRLLALSPDKERLALAGSAKLEVAGRASPGSLWVPVWTSGGRPLAAYLAFSPSGRHLLAAAGREMTAFEMGGLTAAVTHRCWHAELCPVAIGCSGEEPAAVLFGPALHSPSGGRLERVDLGQLRGEPLHNPGPFHAKMKLSADGRWLVRPRPFCFDIQETLTETPGMTLHDLLAFAPLHIAISHDGTWLAWSDLQHRVRLIPLVALLTGALADARG